MPTGTPTPAGPAAPAPIAARALGRYELLREIASGGMAAVFLGRARGMGGFERLVAVKVCHPHLRKDEEFATMFLDEARLAARIHHPNVVGTLDVADEDEALYLVMEYVDGERLSGLIRAAKARTQFVPPGVALQIMTEALLGLHAAHELADHDGAPLGIVHRDVSPQNILVGVDGVTKLVDFGIAKAAARATVTRDGQIKGKLSYMPPEQLASAPITRAADIYAAGVVLWETLTGKRLFAGDTDVATLNQVLRGAVQPASQIAPGVTPALDAVVARALERDPAKRFATAAEFAEALEDVGIKVATTRAVSAWVQDACAESIAERRSALRAVAGHAGHPTLPPGAAGENSNPSRSAPRISRTALEEAHEPRATTATTLAAPTPAGERSAARVRTPTRAASSDDVPAPPSRRAQQRTAAMLTAVALVGFALAGGVWLRGRSAGAPAVASNAREGLAGSGRAERSSPSSSGAGTGATNLPREPAAVAPDAATGGGSPLGVNPGTDAGALALPGSEARAAAAGLNGAADAPAVTRRRGGGRERPAPAGPPVGRPAAPRNGAPADPEHYRPGAI